MSSVEEGTLTELGVPQGITTETQGTTELSNQAAPKATGGLILASSIIACGALINLVWIAALLWLPLYLLGLL